MLFNITIFKGLSSYLNGKQNSSLSLDYIRAVTPPEYYDTDLENYWSNPSNLFIHFSPVRLKIIDLFLLR